MASLTPQPDPLGALGYSFIPGGSGDPSDYRLRKTDDHESGFEWKGQENYDRVGAAVCSWVRTQLVELCGLEGASVRRGWAANFRRDPPLRSDWHRDKHT